MTTPSEDPERRAATYEVTLRAVGPSEYDDVLVERFYASFDGLVAWREGQLFLTLEFAAVGPVPDYRDFLLSVEEALNVRFVEADLDLVDIPEIADRTGRSRQSIQQMVTGQRRNALSAAVPKALTVLGGRRIWDWGEISAWLRQHSILDESDPHRLSRQQLYELNTWLSCRTAIPSGSA